MTEGELSHLIDRFYALSQISAQMQSIVEEIEYMIEGEGGQALDDLRMFGAVLNETLEQEGGKLVSLQESLRLINTTMILLEEVARKEGLTKLMGAVTRYRNGAEAAKDEIQSRMDEDGLENM